MQFFKLFTLVAGLAPLVANASPMDAENTLFKRDICDRTAVAGDTCNHGPGDNQPHICGRNDPRAILHCVTGKWTLERKCSAGQHCTCNGNKATGDIVCKA
ncbi:hypothetical protein BJ166DRAFT_582494 [Pestalotiopsis sp. NC0098]|nr:hypothetical protein BJ166DRAFT_582494 [Pestalotiopsis sp. NC0098]